MFTPRASRTAAVPAAAVSLWAAAAALLAVVVASGPVEVPGLVFDRLTTLLTVLVTGVSALIAAFSTRYLADDARLGRFLALLGMTTAGTIVFAAAANLAVLLAGWLVAGAGFCLLLAHRRDVAGGGEAVRRTVAAFAAGDVALIGAAVLVFATIGNPALDGSVGSALADAGVAGPVALLVVVAALARCAQLPLHAGVVNAGGILLIKLAPVVGLSTAALGLLLAAGVASAIYGTAVMLTRPDVKGALAHSTMAQMGFMLVQVALGAVAAAVVHLVGHAMYKATLFLGSGSAVGALRRREAAPSGAAVGPAVRMTAAIALPAGALAAAVAIAGGLDAVGGEGTAVLLAFAWASGAHAVDGWLRTGPPRALAAAAAATAATAAAYVGLLAAAKTFLAPSLQAAPALDAWIAAPIAAVVVAVTAARISAPSLARIGATGYAWIVDSGWVGRGAAPPRPRARAADRPVVLRPAPRVAS